MAQIAIQYIIGQNKAKGCWHIISITNRSINIILQLYLALMRPHLRLCCAVLISLQYSIMFLSRPFIVLYWLSIMFNNHLYFPGNVLLLSCSIRCLLLLSNENILNKVLFLKIWDGSRKHFSSVHKFYMWFSVVSKKYLSPLTDIYLWGTVNDIE